jgi:DNA-binding winged helix-turn-helix (wHTH) protein
MITEITQEFPQGAETRPAFPKPFELRYVRFGAIQMDLQKETVTKDGSRIRLSGNAYFILLALLERPGEIVTRESLYQCLWPSELGINKQSNLTVTINRLRRSLGDSSQSPLYIETISRRGYVFIAHPQASDRPDGVVVPDAIQTKPFSLYQSVPQASETTAKSAFPMIAYIVGLILIGSMLGAGIWMAAWISYQHHAPS